LLAAWSGTFFQNGGKYRYFFHPRCFCDFGVNPELKNYRFLQFGWLPE